jgi:hypothetical protein
MLSFDLFAFIVHVVVNVIILSPALWLAGRALAGRDKAKFSDAVAIIIIGTLIGAFFDLFLTDFLALFTQFLFFGTLTLWLLSSLIRLVVWLALVKHFFDCGWLKAFAISVLAVILFVVVVILLGTLLGITLITLWW